MSSRNVWIAALTCAALCTACNDDGEGSAVDAARDGAPGKLDGGAGSTVPLDGSASQDAPVDTGSSDRHDGGADASDAAGGPDGALAQDGATDAEGHDAGPPPGVEAGVAACDYGSAASSATADNLNLFGSVVYLAGGAALPAGRYVATYLDGCMKYGGGQGWTVHAYRDTDPNPLGWYLVGATTNDRVAHLPGTVGYAAGSGAYADFEACVAANKALPSVEFDFAGGKLGVWLLDSPYSDNMAGVDGRNPKWQIVRLGSCP